LEVIARLDAGCGLAEGQEGELWLDSGRLHLFDPDSGERLTG
jgi:multiple sugar transport system ATP-binding protein